jgi:hypothetical protein
VRGHGRHRVVSPQRRPSEMIFGFHGVNADAKGGRGLSQSSQRPRSFLSVCPEWGHQTNMLTLGGGLVGRLKGLFLLMGHPDVRGAFFVG